MVDFSLIFGGSDSVSVHQLKVAMDSHDFGTVLDVRTPEEYIQGHIEGSILIPEEEIGPKISSLVPDITTKLYVLCATGRRSKNAVKLLRQMGYSHALNVRGGISDWMSKGYKVAT